MEAADILTERIEAYVEQAHAGGRISYRAQEQRRKALARFAPFFDQVRDRAGLVRFLREHYRSEQEQRPALIAIRDFTAWGAKRGWWEDWLSGVRLRLSIRPPANTLTEVQFEKLVGAMAIDARGSEHTPEVCLRDRALYSCLFYSGCERDQIRLLHRDDVNLAEGWIRIRTNGRKAVFIALHKKALLRLRIWLARNPSSKYAFPSTRRSDMPLEGSYTARRIAEYARAAGIKTGKSGFQMLRHRCATLTARKGVAPGADGPAGQPAAPDDRRALVPADVVEWL